MLGRTLIDTNLIIRLADGRQFALRSYGASAGRPVLCLHGTPGSGLKFRIADRLARKLGLRLYCPDRWGYGLSSLPNATPTLSGFAADMGELADALGLGHFSVVGISGGGPYAAAVAAGLAERVDRLALVAPVGLLLAGPGQSLPLGTFHRFTFMALPRIPGGVRLTFLAFRALLSMSPSLAAIAVAARAGAADRQLFRDRTQRVVVGEMMRAGLTAGVSGPVIDMTLFGSPWDVKLDAITAETRLWLGLEDRNVPIEAARRLARAIPDAALIEIENAGHFWIVQNYGKVFDWLAQSEAR